jgi:hypothetical protein
MLLRNPSRVLTQTLSVSGGASPVTPLIATRSGPSWVSAMVSNRLVTSGPR